MTVVVVQRSVGKTFTGLTQFHQRYEWVYKYGTNYYINAEMLSKYILWININIISPAHTYMKNILIKRQSITLKSFDASHKRGILDVPIAPDDKPKLNSNSIKRPKILLSTISILWVIVFSRIELTLITNSSQSLILITIPGTPPWNILIFPLPNSWFDCNYNSA